MKEIQDQLIRTAMEMGAQDAVPFSIEDIVFDERTLLKCLFGCSGGMHYCPSPKDSVTVKDYIQMMKKYKYGMLILTDNLKDGQDITIALEREAFLGGHPFAFGATECAVCEECTQPEDLPCVSPKTLRIPLYALGIDVYSTVKNVGWELEVVQNMGDPQKNITAVFIE